MLTDSRSAVLVPAPPGLVPQFMFMFARAKAMAAIGALRVTSVLSSGCC